ncbi:MAG TPA: PEP-CTERM sorting domain-containing protein [Gemmataceae bacterium]|nr:PEP-CTERM sorting domain-containing protein [Gemmataceae bacterium]
MTRAVAWFPFAGMYLFAAINSSARADLLPVFVDVNFNSTASQVYADQGSMAGLTFLQNPTYRQEIAPGLDPGVSVTMRTFITPTPNPGETFTFTDRPFNLVMNLTDEPSGASGSLTFAGTFSGTLSMHSSNITATLSSPLVQHLLLGDDYYTVDLGFPPPWEKEGLMYLMPPPPSSVFWRGGGAFQASISIQEIPKAPEPSSLVLAGLGALGLAARFGCRRERLTRRVRRMV